MTAGDEGAMDTTVTEVRQTHLAKARRALAEAENAVRYERAQLADLQAGDRQLTQEAKRLQAIIRQADDRATIRAAQERQAAVEQQRAELGKDIGAQELVIVSPLGAPRQGRHGWWPPIHREDTPSLFSTAIGTPPARRLSVTVSPRGRKRQP
jgi:hypothetical protein